MSGSGCDTCGQAKISVSPVQSMSPDFGLVTYVKFSDREKFIESSVSPGPGLVASALRQKALEGFFPLCRRTLPPLTWVQRHGA